jgi:uncharacterized protein YdaU (DUF1376 family)
MKVRRIDFSPDEWLAGTVGMSAADLGVYWQACALIYSRDGPITDDLIIRAIADDPRRIRNAIERLVERDKLQRSGSQLSNRRCIDELQVSRRRIANAVQNGRSGGRPSKKINGVVKAPGLFSEKLTINHQPSTIKDISPTPRKRGGLRVDGDNPRAQGTNPRAKGTNTRAEDPEFEEFWRAYPRRVDKGHARKAWAIAARTTTPAEIIDGARRYSEKRYGGDEKFTMYPATWLTGERWTDEVRPNGKLPYDTGI